jgi:hypothetical protein
MCGQCLKINVARDVDHHAPCAAWFTVDHVCRNVGDARHHQAGELTELLYGASSQRMTEP